MRGALPALVAAAVLAAAARGDDSCAYEELVPNRYVAGSSPVVGWGSLGADGPAKVQGLISVAGDSGKVHPAAVLLGPDGSVLVHAVAESLPRAGSSPAMTTADYWTASTTHANATGAAALAGLGPGDAVIATAASGIAAAARADLASVTPGASGPGVALVSCEASLSEAGGLSVSCKDIAAVSCGSAPWGAVRDTQLVQHDSETGAFDAWVATDAGLARVRSTGGGADAACTWPLAGQAVTGGWPVRAVTFSPAGVVQDDASLAARGAGPAGSGVPAGPTVVAGGAWKLWVLSADTGDVLRWEWATNVTDGQGGAVSDAVTALAADAETGVVYVGTPSTVDVLYPNLTLGRVDGYSGLPYDHITSMALQVLPPLPACPSQAGGPPSEPCSSSPHADGPSTRLLIGTDAGLVHVDVTPARTAGAAAARSPRLRSPSLQAAAAPLPVASWRWRYMYLERYLPGAAVTGVAAFGNAPLDLWPGPPGQDVVSAVSSAPAPLAPTPAGPPSPAPYGRSGLTWLERQSWTLEAKAARMRQIQTRHDRHGMVAECGLSPMGNVTSCSNGPSDNNGLWTSLVSTAYLMEHSITGSPRALADAQAFLGGLALLNDVTGIPGLMARSCIAPGVPRPAGGKWFNSTAPAYAGWQWKGDTSSDEVDGHTFGWSAAVSLLGSAEGDASGQTAATAAKYLVDVAVYVVKNDFLLIDGDGEPTRWGNWAPWALNGLRSWSDGRGVNSLEILALLSAATAAAPALPDGGAAALPVLRGGWAQLTNATNDYPSNLRNLKIETPIDDNYSDDELTGLPFYAWMATATAMPGPDGSSPSDVRACLAGLDRWYGQMAPLRSDLWAAITSGSADSRASDGPVPSLDAARAAADARWNLETWPLEEIEWNARNSHRKDIGFYQYGDRSGRFLHDSLRVLPANERAQGRWNANPHDLDGGSGGLREMDAGVFLLPYWLGRYHGLVA